MVQFSSSQLLKHAAAIFCTAVLQPQLQPQLRPQPQQLRPQLQPRLQPQQLLQPRQLRPQLRQPQQPLPPLLQQPRLQPWSGNDARANILDIVLIQIVLKPTYVTAVGWSVMDMETPGIIQRPHPWMEALSAQIRFWAILFMAKRRNASVKRGCV